MQGDNQNNQQIVFAQIFINLHGQTRIELLKHRQALLNFIGLVILGGFIILFQDNVEDKIDDKRIVLFFYFSSLVLLIMSKYLLALSFRTILDRINSSNSIEDLRVATSSQSDFFYVMSIFASVILFLFGTLVGLHCLLNNGLLFLISATLSVVLLIVALLLEFNAIKI